MLYAVVASLALAAVMTIGDWIWAVLNLRHTVMYGVIHGAAMCLCLGAAIGIREGRPLVGIVAGPIIGVVAACTFYALAPWLRLSAMFPAWMLFWVLFAGLQFGMRTDARRKQSLGRTIVIGLVAAVLSGLAFYAISGIWTRHDPAGPNYLRNFASWAFAFLPGFAVLFWTPARR